MSEHRIMVVDDSHVMYAEMKEMLEGSGIEISCFCSSGEEALEKYGEVKPELVTMDIVMPGMDGMEAGEKLKERYPDVKLLMVSSLAYDNEVDRAVGMGAVGFIFKPFTKETLLKSLENAFETIGNRTE